jgi:hypothetical protein
MSKEYQQLRDCLDILRETREIDEEPWIYAKAFTILLERRGVTGLRASPFRFTTSNGVKIENDDVQVTFNGDKAIMKIFREDGMVTKREFVRRKELIQ